METTLLGTRVTWRHDDAKNGTWYHRHGVVTGVAYDQESGFYLLVLCTETRALDTLHTSAVKVES